MFEGLENPKDNPCWKGYKPVGTKKKNGKTVPNCVPKESVAEGVGNVGARIKALCQKIYDAGDDEFEYFYHDSPIFAQYWDEYEGDLDSIVAEANPQDLQVMLDEIKSYVQQAGLTEGSRDQVDPNTVWEVCFDYGPHQSDKVKVRASSQEEAEQKGMRAAKKLGHRFPMLNWAMPVEQGVAEGSDTNTFSDFHDWKEAVYAMNADITQMGKAGQYTAIGSNGVIGKFDSRTNQGYINGQQGVAEEETGITKIDNDIKSIDQGIQEDDFEVVEQVNQVEAYGYYYNNRDQRIMWRKVFPNAEAAYAWADMRNATVLGTRELMDEFVDPEMEKTLNYAKRHYAGYDDESSFNKLVQRSMKHGEETDVEQGQEIRQLKRDVARIKRKVGMNESRMYYNTIGTNDKQLRSDFNMRKDDNGWYLAEGASAKQQLEALRAFGQPSTVDFMVEYDLSAFSGSTQTLGPDNVVSPVGSVPKTQKKKVKK